MLYYFIGLAIALFSIGAAGIASSRHFIVVVLSAEVMLAGSMLAATGFFSAAPLSDGSFPVLMLALWAVASAEIVVMVAFYVKMRKYSEGFDLRKMNKLRD